MDQQRKSIQNLTAALDGKREELSAFYRRFGERLLKDSSNPAVLAAAVPPERVTDWRSLMTSRELDNQTILDIKSAIVRQQELLNFRKELDKTLAGEHARQREQFAKLGQAFFSQYSPERDEESFGTAWSAVSKEDTVVDELKERQDRLRAELEESGFFGKMVLQFKMAGIASNIRFHRSKVVKILTEGAERLSQSAEFESRINAGEYEESLTGVYAEIKETNARLAEIQNRAESLDSDFAVVKDTLTACAAAGNPGRRMEELRFRIRETDKRIDALTASCAREYSDKFLDEDGRSVLGNTKEGNSFSDMGAYAHQLEQIAQYRSGISLLRRRIEVLETSARIDAIDRNIATYEYNIADYEQKIAHYRQLIDNLRKSISDASAERVTLVERKEAISKTLEEAEREVDGDRQ